MLLTADAEELYTVVENMTNKELVFGFLGPRGMTLGPNEVVAVPGDLVASLGYLASRGKRRPFDALSSAMSDEVLRINSRPAPVLYDRTAEEPRSMAVDNGVLGLVDPGYETNGSVNFAAV